MPENCVLHSSHEVGSDIAQYSIVVSYRCDFSGSQERSKAYQTYDNLSRNLRY